MWQGTVPRPSSSTVFGLASTPSVTSSTSLAIAANVNNAEAVATELGFEICREGKKKYQGTKTRKYN